MKNNKLYKFLTATLMVMCYNGLVVYVRMFAEPKFCDYYNADMFFIGVLFGAVFSALLKKES